jgi:hypothetical protein
MPIIGNTEIRFHRPEFLKPIFKKDKDTNPPADTGEANGAATGADAERAQQQARSWRYHFFRTIATAPTVQAIPSPSAPDHSNFGVNSGISSSSAVSLKHAGSHPEPVINEEENEATIDRLCARASSLNNTLNLGKARARCNELLAPKSSAARRKESEAAIDYYLTNNYPFSQPIPPKVRELMVLFDMAIRDVHHAFPYGRGNVLVRKRDALAGNAGDKPNEFDVSESMRKNGLTELGRHIGIAGDVGASSAEQDEVQTRLRYAASQMLLGAGSCSAYADTLAAASMERLPELELSNDESLQLRIIGHDDGTIRLDDIELDHTICEAAFTDENGNTYSIILDPWSDMNTPIMKEHSRYEYGEEAVACSYEDPAVPYKQVFLDYMNDAHQRLPETLDNDFLRVTLELNDETIQTADPDKNYSLTEPHQGFVTRESLNTVKEGVKLPVREGTALVTRRPSISSAQENDFL